MYKPLFRFAAVMLPLAFLTAAIPSFSVAAPPPPTVDPTYNLPLTANSAPSQTPLAANWIWSRRTADNQTVLLRRVFTIDKAPKSAALYITADDSFTVYVNNQKVGASAPDPGSNSWQNVQRIDVAGALVVGRNVIAIQATNIENAAGCLAALTMAGAKPIHTDSGWKVLDAEAPTDWRMVDFDDSSWPNATVEAPVTGGPWAEAGGGIAGWPGLRPDVPPYLHHLMIPVASVLDVHPGEGKISGDKALPNSRTAVLNVTPPPPGSTDSTGLLLDFGKELSGRVWITSSTGGSVDVGTGESSYEALYYPRIHQQFFLDPTDAAGSRYSAFRYVHLTFPAAPIGSSPISLHVSVDHLYYPVQYKGSFSCSDPLLTKIWYTGAYTAHLCMQQDIWDAPKRDRERWSGDLHVSGETINNVFGDTFLMEQTLSRLRADAQGGRGSTELPGNDINGIPGYSAAWICTLADFYRHTGDLAYLKTQHDALVSLLEYLRGDAGDQGVFANARKKWLFCDWSPGFDGDSPRARETTQLFLIKAFQDGAFLLQEMGDDGDSKKSIAFADDLETRAHQFIAPTPAGTYSDRLQENAMAIYSGAATPEQQVAIWDSVLKPGSVSWNQLPTPYYNNYVLYAMSMTGHTEEALQFARQFWGGMLDEGATTFWEGYDPRWPKDNFHAHLQADNVTGVNVSLCHGWSTGVTNFLTERVLGIRSTGAGFKTAVIEPDLGDLKWAEGTVPTPHGALHARASSESGKLAVDLSLPDGIAAVVVVPGTSATVNGKVANSVSDSTRQKVSLHLDAGGTYHIIGG